MRLNLKHSIRTTALVAVTLLGFGLSSTAMAQTTKPETTKTATGTTKTPAKMGKKAWKKNWKNMTEEQRLEAMDNHLDKRIARLTKSLKLNTKQAKTLKQLFEARRTEMMDAKARSKGNRKVARAEMGKIKQTYKAKVKAVLTADQQKAYKAMHKQRHQKRHARKMAWMTKELSLTTKQVKQIEAIHADTSKKKRALIDANKGDRSKIRPQLKALRKAKHTKVEAVLTKAQVTKFKAARSKFKGRHHGKKHHHKGPF